MIDACLTRSALCTLSTTMNPLTGFSSARDGAAPSVLGLHLLARMREAIIDGTFQAGIKLSEVQLARDYGVSRTPIREALAKLQQEGLVDVFPHVGTFVRAIDLRDVIDLYQVRSALETLALRLVRGTLNPVTEAEIRTIVESMRLAADEANYERYAEGLDRFHIGLMRLSANRALFDMYHSLMGPIRRLRRLTLRHPGRLRESFDQHVAIAEALLANDAKCEALMAEHFDDAVDVLREVVAQLNT